MAAKAGMHYKTKNRALQALKCCQRSVLYGEEEFKRFFAKFIICEAVDRIAESVL